MGSFGASTSSTFGSAFSTFTFSTICSCVADSLGFSVSGAELTTTFSISLFSASTFVFDFPSLDDFDLLDSDDFLIAFFFVLGSFLSSSIVTVGVLVGTFSTSGVIVGTGVSMTSVLSLPCCCYNK